jgi:hypothetical protein
MTLQHDETLEQIYQLLDSLPSEVLFKPDRMTPDQSNEWHKTRSTQHLIAECWKSKFIIKSGYYPIDEALDRKDISKCKAELIRLSVDELKARWELYQVAEKYVKNAHEFLQYFTDYAKNFPKPISYLWYKLLHKNLLKPYPFNSAYDLFAETVKEDVDYPLSISLEKYYEVPIKKWSQASQFFVEILGQANSDGVYPKLDGIKEDQFKHYLSWDKVTFSWSGMTLWVCQIEAPNDPLLRERLITYNNTFRNVLIKTVKASRKVRGFKWENGQIVPASGRGGVYR